MSSMFLYSLYINQFIPARSLLYAVMSVHYLLHSSKVCTVFRLFHCSKYIIHLIPLHTEHCNLSGSVAAYLTSLRRIPLPCVSIVCCLYCPFTVFCKNTRMWALRPSCYSDHWGEVIYAVDSLLNLRRICCYNVQLNNKSRRKILIINSQQIKWPPCIASGY
jgi:hypothetical protein